MSEKPEIHCQLGEPYRYGIHWEGDKNAGTLDREAAICQICERRWVRQYHEGAWTNWEPDDLLDILSAADRERALQERRQTTYPPRYAFRRCLLGGEPAST